MFERRKAMGSSRAELTVALLAEHSEPVIAGICGKKRTTIDDDALRQVERRFVVNAQDPTNVASGRQGREVLQYLSYGGSLPVHHNKYIL
jgi:hypothetical protein